MKIVCLLLFVYLGSYPHIMQSNRAILCFVGFPQGTSQDRANEIMTSLVNPVFSSDRNIEQVVSLNDTCAISGNNRHRMLLLRLRSRQNSFEKEETQIVEKLNQQALRVKDALIIFIIPAEKKEQEIVGRFQNAQAAGQKEAETRAVAELTNLISSNEIVKRHLRSEAVNK